MQKLSAGSWPGARERPKQRGLGPRKAKSGEMMEFSFVLKYRLAESNQDLDDVIERLAEAGCDDSLIGTGTAGRIALDFTREAESADAAVFSALSDVKRALPDAELIEAGPDYVGLSDIANIIGVSRQYMRKLWTENSSSFPPPVHAGSASLWHLADVLNWLSAKGSFESEKAGILQIADTAMQVNIAKGQSRTKLDSCKLFLPLVA